MGGGHFKPEQIIHILREAQSHEISIIHPGKPRNPDESGLDELLKRAEPLVATLPRPGQSDLRRRTSASYGGTAISGLDIR